MRYIYRGERKEVGGLKEPFDLWGSTRRGPDDSPVGFDTQSPEIGGKPPQAAEIGHSGGSPPESEVRMDPDRTKAQPRGIRFPPLQTILQTAKMNELQSPSKPESLVDLQRQSYRNSPRLDQVVWEAKSQDTGNVLFSGSQSEVSSWMEIHLFDLAELGVNAYSVPTGKLLS